MPSQQATTITSDLNVEVYVNKPIQLGCIQLELKLAHELDPFSTHTLSVLDSAKGQHRHSSSTASSSSATCSMGDDEHYLYGPCDLAEFVDASRTNTYVITICSSRAYERRANMFIIRIRSTTPSPVSASASAAAAAAAAVAATCARGSSSSSKHQTINSSSNSSDEEIESSNLLAAASAMDAMARMAAHAYNRQPTLHQQHQQHQQQQQQLVQQIQITIRKYKRHGIANESVERGIMLSQHAFFAAILAYALDEAARATDVTGGQLKTLDLLVWIVYNRVGDGKVYIFLNLVMIKNKKNSKSKKRTEVS